MLFTSPMITQMKKKDAIPSPKNACSSDAMCAISCLFADNHQVSVTCVCQLFPSNNFAHVLSIITTKEMVQLGGDNEHPDEKGNAVLCNLSLVWR